MVGPLVGRLAYRPGRPGGGLHEWIAWACERRRYLRWLKFPQLLHIAFGVDVSVIYNKWLKPIMKKEVTLQREHRFSVENRLSLIVATITYYLLATYF